MNRKLFAWLGLISLLSASAGGGAIAANVQPGDVAIDVELVADISGGPIDMHHPGDGRLYVASIFGGQVTAIDDGATSTFLDLTSNPDVPFTTIAAGGLLGVAFHPNYLNEEAAGYHKFYSFSSDWKTVNQTSSTTNVSPGNQLTGLPDFYHPEMYAPATSGDPLTDWTNPDSPSGGNTDFDHFNVLREWTANDAGTAIDTNVAPRVVLRMAHGFAGKGSHNGGGFRFGPDGYLYLSTGDGGGNAGQDHDGGVDNGEDGHTNGTGNGQDLSVVYGKVIRIDPTASVKNSANGEYGIPAENPYVLDQSNPSYLKEIYANGFRNPWKLSFDDLPGGTGALYLSNVGQHHREEIDIITGGGNYGWGYLEGNVRLVTSDNDTGEPDPIDPSQTDGTPVRVPPEGFVAFEAQATAPLVDYLTRRQFVNGQLVGDGTAVTGGFVYRGSAIPELYGKYVFGDYSTTSGGGRPPPPGLPSDVGRLFYIDPILPGDYNNNGKVDAADYTVWRDHLGMEAVLPNDPTPGMIDPEDYDTWKDHFGGTPADIVLQTDAIYEFDFNYNSALWGTLLGFGQDQDGELYALLQNGNVLKIVAAESGIGTAAFANVPEPASLGLMLACGLGFLVRPRCLAGGQR
jgi:glucose/arabinose dehydrogenase